MGYLQDLFPVIDEGLRVSSRRERYKNDPVAWAREYLGIQQWSKQREIAESVRDCRRTVVIAAHGTGKTYEAAVVAAWWIDVFIDDDPFVASTAPTFDQVALIWDNIRDIYRTAKARHEEYKRRVEANLPLGEYAPNDHPLPGSITRDHKWKMDDGRLIGEGRKPADENAETAFQGRHAKRLLAIGDESVGIIREFIEALGNIATGELNRQLLLCNPTDISSETFRIWSSGDDTWNRIQISLFHSPTFTHEEGFDLSKAKGLSGPDYAEEKKRDWGEDDPRYIARVLGQWAQDVGNALLSEVEIASAINTVVVPDPEALPQQGWDIARMGPDFTIGYQAWPGEVWETDDATGEPVTPTGRRGLHIRKIGKWGKAPLTGEDPENLGTAQRIDALLLGEGAPVLSIDAAGMGGAVIDGLREIQRKRGGKPRYFTVEVFGNAPPSDKREYINARVEQYFELKRRMFAGEIDLDGSETDLFDQLRSITFEYNTAGAKKITSKDDMKRKGKKSPDEADAVWYAAMDVTGLIEGDLAGAKKGDRVYKDPWALLNSKRYGPGLPD